MIIHGHENIFNHMISRAWGESYKQYGNEWYFSSIKRGGNKIINTYTSLPLSYINGLFHVDIKECEDPLLRYLNREARIYNIENYFTRFGINIHIDLFPTSLSGFFYPDCVYMRPSNGLHPFLPNNMGDFFELMGDTSDDTWT